MTWKIWINEMFIANWLVRFVFENYFWDTFAKLRLWPKTGKKSCHRYQIDRISGRKMKSKSSHTNDVKNVIPRWFFLMCPVSTVLHRHQPTLTTLFWISRYKQIVVFMNFQFSSYLFAFSLAANAVRLFLFLLKNNNFDLYWKIK